MRSDLEPGQCLGRVFCFDTLLGTLAARQLYRAVLIERSTASLGQQSTFSPADFW